jgi:LysR family hydrogen peroxide-inducible transcriptional activator
MIGLTYEWRSTLAGVLRMNISALTLRDLEYVVTLAEQRHFGRAAIHCHVSQPALSEQIRKVEDFLGVRLFERSNRQVVLTKLGEQIAQQCRVVLDEARKVAEIAQQQAEPLTGRFVLGAISTLAPYYLPYVIGPVRKRFPKLELRLKEGMTNALLTDLRAGSIDGVLASPTFRDNTLVSFELFFEPFMLAAPEGHPIAEKDRLKPSDLQASEMVLLEDGHCLKDQTLALCPANRRGNIRHFQITSIETLRHMVASGLGYTLIPLLAMTDDAKFRRLIRYQKFVGKPVGRSIVLVCRRSYPRIKDMELLARFLRDQQPKGTLPPRAVQKLERARF